MASHHAIEVYLRIGLEVASNFLEKRIESIISLKKCGESCGVLEQIRR